MGYFNCQCLSALCLSLLIVFRITWWSSAGKELSPWLSAPTVFLNFIPSQLYVFLSSWVSGELDYIAS